MGTTNGEFEQICGNINQMEMLVMKIPHQK